MKLRGKKYLAFAGIIEVIIGVVSFALTFWLLSQTDNAITVIGIPVAKDALWTLVLVYGIAAFQILAGVIGVVCAGSIKHYKVCYFFGICLILIATASLTQVDFSLNTILVNALNLVVPIAYLYGAMLNNQKA